MGNNADTKVGIEQYGKIIFHMEKNETQKNVNQEMLQVELSKHEVFNQEQNIPMDSKK